jgi:spore maturation protein CgeB
MKYDYGNPKQGLSFEYDVFASLFKKIKGAEVEVFDYREKIKRVGKREMNRLLVNKCKEFKPDLIFTFLFESEIYPETLDKIRKYSKASITWMADDKWRWELIGKKYCKNFDYVITTDPEAVAKYESVGYKNAILSQWAIDPDIYKDKQLKKDIPVSFIGRDNAWRRFVIKELRRKGIEVECYGFGWKNGRVTQEEMIDIFNRSKINLNLSNSVKFNLKYLLDFNLVWNKDISFARNIFTIFGPQLHTIISKKRKEDIKSRFFEVIGSGGFLLSYDVEHLSDYLDKDKELVVYKDINDLASKIFYYLGNDQERKDIENNGYRRVIDEHTYEKRFKEIFKKMSKNEDIFSRVEFV